MIFGSRQKLKSHKDFRIQCGDAVVERVETVKYLGFLLDEQLNGVAHVGTCIKRISSRMAVLYRNAHLLNNTVRKTLCSALVQPYFDYCCSSWYNNVTMEYKRKLDVLQRNMVRYILGLDFRALVDFSHFRSLGWLSVADRVKNFRLLHIFRINANLAPQCMKENFRRVHQVHDHNTRGSVSDFYVPKIGSSEILKRSFFFSGIKDWNSLPHELKSIKNEKSFKSRLKAFIMAQY